MIYAIPFPDIDPIIFSVSLFGKTLALRWYALAYITGILLGWRYILRIIKTPRLFSDKYTIPTAQQIDDLVSYIIIGVIIGGRLGYVTFYQPGYYFQHPVEILKVWQGGMSFHGGFLGVVLAITFFALKNKIYPPLLGDLVASAAPIGLFFGRIANFINGELWGRPTANPLGVIFPDPNAQICPDDWIGICARHPSQLYEAFLEGAILFALLTWLIWRRDALKTPGLIIGCFITGYGIARFIIEFFRQADLQYITASNPWGHVIRFGETASSFGLTMGQILSIPMIVVGIIIIFWAKRKP